MPSITLTLSARARAAAWARSTGFALSVLLGSLWAQAAPVVPGFTVSTYAQAPGAVRMDFDAAGVLYVGNASNSLSGAQISRVAPGGGVATAFGPSVFDPDAVVIDRTGSVTGVPGAVVVGGSSSAAAAAALTAIRPDQTSFAIIPPSSLGANPSDLAIDSTGRLLFTDFGDGDPAKAAVFALSQGTLTRLFIESAGAEPDSMTLDTQDRIYTTGSDGVIRIHDASGALLNGTFVTGLGSFPLIEFARGGAFGSDLYALSNTAGTLLRIDSSGLATVIGSGFANTSADLAFGPDGALYVSQLSDNTILRIALAVPEPTSVMLFALGGSALLLARRRTGVTQRLNA
jgi:sugar lactone lactonase YvrE